MSVYRDKITAYLCLWLYFEKVFKGAAILGFKNTLTGALDALLDAIYPPNLSCHICNRKVAGTEDCRLGNFILCTSCHEKLSFIMPPKCSKCGKHIESTISDYSPICRDCLKGNHTFYKGLSVLEYDALVKDLIYRYKYKGERYLKEPMIHWMLEALVEESWDIDGILPVPLHPIRERQRGFNQAKLLARGLSQNLGVPIIEGVLIRVRNTPQQAKLGRAERLKNLNGAFRVKPAGGGVIEGKSLLLVDDVYTTGSTADQCSRALMDAGAHRVYVITLAIGSGY